MTIQPNNRRYFLQSSLATISLPFLPSLHAQDPQTVNTPPPHRFACLYHPNGIYPDDWWAEGSGKEMKLGPALQPLQKWNNEILVINGLKHPLLYKPNTNLDPHFLECGFLCGVPPNEDPAIVKQAQTMDQYLANTVGRNDPLPALTLGLESINPGTAQGGLSQLYMGCLSWRTASTPASKEIDPSVIFDLLFDNKNLDTKKSILDGVLTEAHSLRQTLSGAEGRQLDAYLQSVRELEQRTLRLSTNNDFEVPLQRPIRDISDFDNYASIMLDLLIAAFQTRRTRIATLMIGNCRSIQNFSFLPGVAKSGSRSGHHSVSHWRADPDKLSGPFRAITNWHTGYLGKLLERLSAIPEGDQRLLDHCTILYGSALFDGSKHSREKLPILLCGGGSGTLKTGRVIDYSALPGDERVANALFLSIIQNMGVKCDRFHDARKPLPGLQ